MYIPLALALLALFAVIGSIIFVEFLYGSCKIGLGKRRKRIRTLNTAGAFLLLIAVGIIHNSEFINY